jgi:hypothetical protein
MGLLPGRPPLRIYRALGLALGLGVLAWQLVNLGLGRFRHEYLAADVAASLVLIAASSWRGERGPASGMLVGFAMFGGIFLAATTGKLIVGGAHPGTIAAGLGLVPCLIGIAGLGRWLARLRDFG